VARLGAERVAKLDALRNILETIKGIKINGKRNAADLMSNGEIRTKVEGVARNFKVVDTKYYSDGSVDVVVEMPLDKSLTQALVPKAKSRAKLNTKGPKTFTGLVVNAKNLGVQPSMAPRILDEDGNEVYGTTVVSDKALEQGGLATYLKQMDSAKKDKRVGERPLVVKALSLAEGEKTDVVIANIDAEKLTAKDTNLSFLTNGKVIFVVD
jgi:hypothetical protein